MELDTRPTLEELDRVSVEPEIDTFNTGNPIRRASASTYAVESKRSSISTFVTATSFQGSIATFHTAETDLRSIKQESTVLRSSWYKLLKSENLIPRPLEEKDWSGRGEHAEFGPDEWSKILDILPVEGLLGNSATAIVESVRCRRVLLARKTVRCNRRMKRTDALKEVQHLKKLKHSHIVQVVGTYTFKQDLAILLYPAAEYNLETFMESIITESPGRKGFRDQEKVYPKLRALTTFFGCLAHTIRFLHRNATKHMDIKPKNLLIRDMRYGSSSPRERYKIYIADFGITRSYKRAADAETDSPTPFTRMYAAPEVVDQRKRGLSADIFSLGCVFAEMLAVLSGSDRESKKEDLLAVASSNQTSPRSYQANLPLVEQWLREIIELNIHNLLFLELTPMPNYLVEMIDSDPGRRPSAEMVASWFAPSTPCCTNAAGPDPFLIERTIEEDAEDEDNSKAKCIYEQDIETFHSAFQGLAKQLKMVPGEDARLSEVLDDLILRLKDWKDYGIENSGRLLLHGTFEIPEEERRTDREVKTPVSQIDLQYKIYLFKRILLVCKESPTRRIPANITSLKNLSSARSTGHVLNLKGRVFIQNIFATKVPEAHGSYILKIHFYGTTGMETIPIRFTTLDMMEQWANQIYRMCKKRKFLPRGSGISGEISGSGFRVPRGSEPDLPTSIKLKVHCSEIGKTLALAVWPDTTYDALKRYIEVESQLFRDCSNFHLYVEENRLVAITSDEDLQIHLDAWWKAVMNGAGSHCLELWY